MANFIDQADTIQHISGSDDHDIFIIDGKSTDFGWSATQDGEGIVVWNEAGFDVLHGVEEIKFNDIRLVRDENGSYQRDELNRVTEAAEETSSGEVGEVVTTKIVGVSQYVQGTSEKDVFVINADADSYGWGPTIDGQGLVIWNGSDFDIVYNVEEVRFNNLTLTQSEDGSYSATVTSSEESSSATENTQSEDASQNTDSKETDTEAKPVDDAVALDTDEISNTDTDQSSEDKGTEENPESSEGIESSTESNDEEPTADSSETKEVSEDDSSSTSTDPEPVDDSSSTDAEEVANADLTDSNEDETIEESATDSETADSIEDSSGEGTTTTENVEPSLPGAKIIGSDKQIEGKIYSYHVELDEAVQEDTWVTLQVNSGTAFQDDGSHVFVKNGSARFGWYSNDHAYEGNRASISQGLLDVIARQTDKHHGLKPGELKYEDVMANGVENLTFDYTLAKDGQFIFGTDGEVKVLVKAGETQSESFEIHANVETNVGKINFGTPGTEETEEFSIEIAQIGDQLLTQSGQSKTVTIQDTPHNASPIGIDLNRDGKIGVTGETSSRDKQDIESIGRTVEFDIDGDGDLDLIEWFDGSGDGILIDNRDGNAANDMNGKRLFGDEGGKYLDGYEKLALFDNNDDGTLTSEELQGLELWVDDGDAIVEEGELQTLAEHGIVEISVISEDVLDDHGRTLIQSKAFTADGNELLTEDVWFAQGSSDLSEYLNWSAETTEIDEPQNFDMEIRFLEADHMIG